MTGITRWVMPGRVILFLGMLLCCASLAAQAPTASTAPVPSANKGKAKASRAEAELALDGAKRWTQAAITDSTHLSPIEQDILLIRLADTWKDADRQKSHEYLDRALDQLKRDFAANVTSTQRSNYSFLMQSVSEEIHAVDPKAWNELLKQLPEWEAKDIISREANELADADPAGAMELAEQSLTRGGAFEDASTLVVLIDYPESADKLFGEMLTTAAKPEADPNMFGQLTRLAFSEENGPEVKAFFNSERQQRVLDLLAQTALSSDTTAPCSYRLGLAEPLIPRYPAQMQEQLRSALADCRQKQAQATGATPDTKNATESTDDLVSAMNEASNAKKKASLRQQAVHRAAEVDHNYEKAIQLCLGASPEEREAGVGSQDLFDRWATVFASAGMRAAVQKNDIDGLQRFLDLLPARIKASPELDAVHLLAKRNREKAKALLADARALLEIYEPDHAGQPGWESTYMQLLWRTADLSLDDVPDAWRIVVIGLNQLEHAQRVETRIAATPTASLPEAQHSYALYPFEVPPAAITDEGFARASIDDLDSVAYREQLRLGVVGAFLERYKSAIEAGRSKSTVATVEKKN